eukprot:INCI1208.1.p1 GENE.INCI1208.1~~INCI1208.1.p1  ORF type:complete len:371 (-),score=38.67 INCI1208.1:248-1360(-)
MSDVAQQRGAVILPATPPHSHNNATATTVEATFYPLRLGLTVDVHAPRHSSPQPSSRTTTEEEAPSYSTGKARNFSDTPADCVQAVAQASLTTGPKAQKACSSSATVAVPTPSRRAQRQAVRREVVFDFENGTETPRSVSSRDVSLDSCAAGSGDDPMAFRPPTPPKGRRGYLAGLLHASMGPRGNVPGTPMEKQRAQTDEDASSMRMESRSRLLAAATSPKLSLAEDEASAAERRKQTKIWRGKRSATDEYSMISRYKSMHAMAFSWRQCQHCQFQFLSTSIVRGEPQPPATSERSLSCDERSSTPPPSTQRQERSVSSPEMQNSSLAAESPNALESDIFGDLSNGVPKFSKQKYCSQECYWSMVYLLE